MANSPTKKQLQELVAKLGERVSDMLDPVLTREELVAQVQELDALVNEADEEDETEADEEDETTDEMES